LGTGEGKGGERKTVPSEIRKKKKLGKKGMQVNAISMSRKEPEDKLYANE